MPSKTRPSRGLLDRQRLVERLQEALGALVKELAVRRAELLAPDLQAGETMPDGELELELYLRLLERRFGEAAAAEGETRRAFHALKVASRHRDETTAELNRQLGRLRLIVDLALGKNAARELFDFKGPTPRRQEGVYNQAADVVSRLGGLEPGGGKRAGVSVDPAEWKAMLWPAYDRLGRLRTVHKRREKRLDGLLIAKDKAFATFDVTARGLVRTAEGQCLMLGLKEWAERIRQFSRKRKRPGPKPKRKSKKKAAAEAAGKATAADTEKKAKKRDALGKKPKPKNPLTNRVT